MHTSLVEKWGSKSWTEKVRPVFELIKSAKEEILIIFSTANAFKRQDKAGAVDFLIMTAKSKGVKVRILSPIDDYVRNIIDKIERVRPE